ncbi:MAG: hypothetical protein AAB480_03845 [Patescibacteria group bacterium]
MPGEQTIDNEAGVQPIRWVTFSEIYRKQNPDGSFPVRTKEQQLALQAEIAAWAALMR